MRPRQVTTAAILGAVSVIACLALAPAAHADWTAFRGSDHTASAAGQYPTEWGPGRNVAWRTPLPGEGWSSPVVADGRVYLTAAVPGGGGRTLNALCLDAESGAILWNTRVFSQSNRGARKHEKNSHASATPVLEGDRLYVHFGNQGTACLSTDGRVLWVNRDLTYEPVHGNGGSPIIVNDKLIFSCDGASNPFVVALNKQTGRVIWRQPRGVSSRSPFSFSTPLAIEVDGRTQVISPGSGAVYGYDPNTGDALWGVGYGDGYSVVPQPVHHDGLVFICTGFNSPTLLAIRPAGARGDVTRSNVAWSTSRGAPLTPTPLIVGDMLFMVSDQGVASCLDAATGRVHWQQRIGGGYSASPVHADGKVYFQSEDGPATVLEASTQYVQVARNDLGERSLATYAFDGGAIYIRTDAALYRVQAAVSR